MTLFNREPQHRQWIGLITLIGLALRLYGLDSESFWLDEIITANRAFEPLHQILFGWDSATQGPLYYLLMKAWCALFGNGEFALRIWSVIFGTLTIPCIYLLGRQLFSGTSALLASLFISVHPFAIHYSQEARPYALFLLLSVLSFFYLLILMRQFRWPAAWTYLVITTAAFYTHVFAMFLVLSHLLIFWTFKRDSRFRGALRSSRPYYAVFGLLFLFCLPEIWQNVFATIMKIGGSGSATWIPVPTFLDLVNLPARYFMALRLGQIVLAAAGLLAVVRMLSEPQLRAGFRWLTIVAICFWLIPWIVSVTVTPVWVMRYTIPGLLVVVFVMSTAAASLQLWPRRMFVAALVVLTAFPLWDYHTKVDKDPWRQTSAYLTERVRDDDLILSLPTFTVPSMKFYLPENLQSKCIRPKSTFELDSLLSGNSRLWEVTSYEIQDSASQALTRDIHTWGTELRRAKMNDMLDLNPHRFWCMPIEIALRENAPLELGPEPLPTINP